MDFLVGTGQEKLLGGNPGYLDGLLLLGLSTLVSLQRVLARLQVAAKK